MTNKQLNHSEGATFSGTPFWLGLITLFFAVYGLFQNENILILIISGIGVIAAIILLMAIKGIRVDYKKRMAYRYFNLILTKLTYEKLDLQYYTAAELRLFSENQAMNMRSISTTVRTRVYEIYLKSSETAKHLLIESTDYSKAKDILKRLSDGLNITSENRYEEWRQRVRGNRRKRTVSKK